MTGSVDITLCEVCGGPAVGYCGIDDQPMLAFCARHLREHLRCAHANSQHAQHLADALDRRKEREAL